MNFGNFILRFVLEFSISISLCAYTCGMMLAFFDFKSHKWWQSVLEFVSFCAFEIILNGAFAAFLFYAVNKFNYFGYTFYFSCAVTTFIYVAFHSKYQIKPKLMTALAVYSLYFLLTTLGSVIPSLFTDLPTSSGKVLDIIFRWGSFLLMIPFGLLIHHYNLNKIKHIHKMSALFVVVYCTCEMVIVVLFNKFKGTSENPKWFYHFYLALLFLILAFIHALSYLSFYNVNKSHSDALELQVKNSELEKNAEMLSMSEKNLEEMRKLKHDQKNQYGLMKLLIQEKRYDDLAKFFDQYGDGIIEPLSFISCDNKPLSAVLNMEFSKAKARGIDFDIKISVPRNLSTTTQLNYAHSMLISSITQLKPALDTRLRNRL